VSELTYPEAGATRDGPLPGGYRHLRHRTRLGAGVFDAAGEAVLTFAMHRAAGARVEASAPRAAPGVSVTVGLGVGRLRLPAPCRVVWAVADERRIGFGYGTLPGHPERGEESFVVERADDGVAWLVITAFSRPARWFTRLAGPVGVAFQKAYARRLGAALRRAAGAPPAIR
jgi:uncharacterized protein (UPF0548 family)